MRQRACNLEQAALIRVTGDLTAEQPRLRRAQQIFGDASHLIVSATCASAASAARSFAHSMW